MMLHFLGEERPTHRRCKLAELLLELSPGLRGSRMHAAVSFRPNEAVDTGCAVGPLRAAFADQWEHRFREAVPSAALRKALEPPVPIGTVLEFSKLAIAREFEDLEKLVCDLLDLLRRRVKSIDGT